MPSLPVIHENGNDVHKAEYGQAMDEHTFRPVFVETIENEESPPVMFQ
jgi:hypothetical protein